MTRPCKCGKCRLCWLIANRPEYAIKFKEPVPNTPAALHSGLRLPCIHMGPVLEWCTTCGDGSRHVRDCAIHERCTQGLVSGNVQSCLTCPDYEMERQVEVGTTSIKAGIVLGAYGWPNLIDLQIRVIRRTCGDVPILVSDDMQGSPVASRSASLREICRKHRVEYSPNSRRIGHGGGDIAAFWKGVKWGSALGLDVVAKLSQRLLILKGSWLEISGRQLLASGLPMSIQKDAGKNEFPLRTEGCLMSIPHWSSVEVLNSILPREYYASEKRYAEQIIYDALQRHLGGVYWPWDVLSDNREYASPKTLWHNSHKVEHYRAVAREMDVVLEDDFHCDGWQTDLAKGRYKYG